MNGLETQIWSYLIAIASGITPIIGYKLYIYLTTRHPMKKLWKEYLSKETYGILSCSDLSIDIDSLSTGLYDALALSNIREFLSSFPNTLFHAYSSKRYPPYLNRNSIILFGGPISNNLVRDIMIEKKKTFLQFQDHTIINTKNNKRYKPIIKDNKIIKDFGIVIKTKNPYNPSLNLMIFSGCFDYGTFLSVEALTNPESVKKVLKIVGTDYFEIVVSGDIIEGTPQTPVIEDYIVRKVD